MKNCLPWEVPHSGAGEECVEEGVVDTTRDELTTTHVPHVPMLVLRGGWRVRSEADTEKKERWEEIVLVLFLISLYPNLLLIGNKLN